MINDIEHLFNVLLVDYIFFGKRSVKNFLFMFPLGCLLVSKFKSTLIKYTFKNFYGYMLYKCIVPVCGLPF